MDKIAVFTNNAPQPIGPYSQAVKAGGFLFVSGQIAIEPESGDLVLEDIKMEAGQVMKNLESILQVEGLNFNNVVKTSIFLKSMNDFGDVNEIYGSYFKDNQPARETVEVSKLPKDVNVEISVVAHYL